MVSAEQLNFDDFQQGYSRELYEGTDMGFNNFYMTYSAEDKAGKKWNPYTKKIENKGTYTPTYVKPAYVKPAYVKPAYVKPAYVKPVTPKKPAYVKPAYVRTKTSHKYTDPIYGSVFYSYWLDSDVGADNISLAA